jgi:hypothetical protein
MDRDKKGYITLLLLILIAFGFLLSGGLMALLDQTPASTDRYVLVDTTPYPIHKTLQLSTLTFMFSAPATICIPGTDFGDEPGILYAFSPGSNETIGTGGQIKVWYYDEHALTLGVNPGVTPFNAATKTAINPSIGVPASDPAARDGTSLNFLFYPGLYLTDITDDETSRTGDAQNGGVGYPPSIVYGYWKAYGTDDPPFVGGDTNKGTLPAAADQVSSIPTQYINTMTGERGTETEYSAEIIWNVSDLKINGAPLSPNRRYRAQFVIHDGDMTRGADIGLGCTCLLLL